MATKTFKVILLLMVFIILAAASETPNDKEKDLKKLAVANNDLGVNLYHQLVKGNSENVFFSPFSLSNAFGMLFAGAGGNSAKQLRCVLGYDAADLPNSKVPSAFNQYINKILPKSSPKDPEYILNLANELLLQKDFSVNPAYKKEVKDLFHAYIKEVDFKTNSNQIVKEVNDFVKEQTHGKIDQLLSDLDPSTILLILNAIYFKGTWKTQFDKKATRDEMFYNDGSDSKAKKVPLMHLTTNFPYASDNGIQAIEFPYKGDNVSMIVLLPEQRDGLSNLENILTRETIIRIQKKMYSTKVIVTFPKFKVEYKRQMNPDFQALGAKDIFSPKSANFSGITSNKGIYVSEVIHKAAIEVNEEGSEAAAATAIGLRTLAAINRPPPTPRFTADHPFIYAIVDKRNNLILFLGRLTEL